MSSEWTSYKLSETGRIVTGKTPKGGVSEFEGADVPFVTPPDFVGEKWIKKSTRAISEAGAQSVKGSIIPSRSVLVTCIGSDMGKAALASTRCVTNQQINAVVVDESRFSPEFIFYGLSLRKSEIRGIAGGSAQPILNKSAFGELRFECPPLQEQVEIAELIRPLDDRITLLRETNATLEAIAQALFKSWFVDFDPVRAKMEGRAPEGMDEVTAALFSDSFEESELGLVPRGWRVSSFRETIQIIGGGTPKTSNPDFWGGDIPWFSVVDAPVISDVFVVNTEKYITQAGLNGSSTKLLPSGTTIISARGTVGRLALTGCPMTMNQSCYGLRGLAGDDYFTYFSTKRLVEQLKQRAHGSVFDTITQESFAGVLVCFPIESAIAAFEDNVGSLMLRIRENLMQAQTLATLRDTLLPRLISGQLRLPEAQAAAEDALA